MEQRPKAATQAEVQTLLEEAREGVSFTIDSKLIAGFVLPELKKGLPSAEEINWQGLKIRTSFGVNRAFLIE